MKKIGILSTGIILVLLLGMADIRRQKERGNWEMPKQAVMTDAAERISGADAAEEIDIRVLIRSDHYESEYHEAVTIASESGFTMAYGNQEKEYQAGDEVTVTAESSEFEGNNIVYLASQNGKFTLTGLQRDIQNPVYEGKIEIRKTDGGLLVINELPLETYLCYVVPSEMPSGYPEEALKAQAVCARTYAQKQMQEMRAQEFNADVDDSVSYQVYNNQGRTQRTDTAVEKTRGIVLEKDGELLDARYYSTSCGMDLGRDMSDETVFAAFLTEDNKKAYEAQEPWYRWKTEVCLAELEDVAEIAVTKRAQSGRVEEIEVTSAASGTAETIAGEYKVREFLDRSDPLIYLQDGETVNGMGLLPSAFFVMLPVYDEEGVLSGYRLNGGGYGHGEGMSQNGAKGMAQEGMGYREILESYYGSFDGAE